MSVATHTPDPLAEPAPVKSKPAGPAAAKPATEEVVQGQSVPTVVLSTGDIRIQYEIIDLVFAQATSNEFAEEGVPFEEVFKAVKSRLAQEALKLGANGVAHIRFEFRTAKTVLELPRSHEIYACGTAVRLEARDER